MKILMTAAAVVALRALAVTPSPASPTIKDEKYVETKCTDTWKRWTPQCCTSYKTKEDCVKANPKGCTLVDLDAMREKTKGSSASPAC